MLAEPFNRPVGGWTCCVEQGHYGHPARKATWLYAVGTDLPSLRWGSSGKRVRLDPGPHSWEEAKEMRRNGEIVPRIAQREMVETPVEFRDLLLSLARAVEPRNISAISR